jgi:hypothetical protein
MTEQQESTTPHEETSVFKELLEPSLHKITNLADSLRKSIESVIPGGGGETTTEDPDVNRMTQWKNTLDSFVELAPSEKGQHFDGPMDKGATVPPVPQGNPPPTPEKKEMDFKPTDVLAPPSLNKTGLRSDRGSFIVEAKRKDDMEERKQHVPAFVKELEDLARGEGSRPEDFMDEPEDFMDERAIETRAAIHAFNEAREKTLGHDRSDFDEIPVRTEGSRKAEKISVHEGAARMYNPKSKTIPVKGNGSSKERIKIRSSEPKHKSKKTKGKAKGKAKAKAKPEGTKVHVEGGTKVAKIPVGHARKKEYSPRKEKLEDIDRPTIYSPLREHGSWERIPIRDRKDEGLVNLVTEEDRLVSVHEKRDEGKVSVATSDIHVHKGETTESIPVVEGITKKKKKTKKKTNGRCRRFP